MATRGLFFLCAAFHVVWALLVYAFPSSIARWITLGDSSVVAPYYVYTVTLVVMASLIGALYPHTFRKFLFLVLVLKGIEMLAAFWGHAGAQFTPRLIFHLVMNGVLWQAILGLALWRVRKQA